ncbi:MAG TPA: ABC transporter substrate-binding protein [Chloroflexota bacterium]|jgi:4,5-dihydroxyphthalate decarboxylase|nr:ABC transporter substrate-binding protein [Chloroflexota bacterium]
MAEKLPISLGFGSNVRTRPVLDGKIEPEGIELRSTAVHGSELFWRQLRFAEFDVSEMSLSSLLMLTASGKSPWWALPIFTSRQFFHTGILVRSDRGIEKPQDLKGKRVGVPEYQQTAALWARGALKHEFGVDPMDCEWWMERVGERSHGGAVGFTPPPGLNFNRIPAEKSIGSMLLNGELDATLLYLTDSNLVDRSRVDLSGNPNIKPLFADREAEGARFYKSTGLFPINHGVVVRRSILEQHPWVAQSLFDAFNKAKNAAHDRLLSLTGVYSDLGLLPAEDRANLEIDPYPYGIKANQNVLETVTRWSNEQGLTPRVMSLEEVFAPSIMAT